MRVRLTLTALLVSASLLHATALSNPHALEENSYTKIENLLFRSAGAVGGK